MDPTLRERLRAVKDLLGLFRLERLVYLAVTFGSVLILWTCAVWMLIDGGRTELILGIFGGSGGILYTSGRLLRMWSDALRVLSLPAEGAAH